MQCVSNRCKDLFQQKKYFGVTVQFQSSSQQLISQVQAHGEHGQLHYMYKCGAASLSS